MSEKCPNCFGLAVIHNPPNKDLVCPTCHGTGTGPHEASYSSGPSKPYTCPECGGTFYGQHFCVGKSVPREEGAREEEKSLGQIACEAFDDRNVWRRQGSADQISWEYVAQAVAFEAIRGQKTEAYDLLVRCKGTIDACLEDNDPISEWSDLSDDIDAYLTKCDEGRKQNGK